MLNYENNQETIERIKEIDEKLHDENLDNGEYTKLMYEQLLRGMYLNVV
jgi:hypothetical protein